jgi:hypothetical protein
MPNSVYIYIYVTRAAHLPLCKWSIDLESWTERPKLTADDLELHKVPYEGKTWAARLGILGRVHPEPLPVF